MIGKTYEEAITTEKRMTLTLILKPLGSSKGSVFRKPSNLCKSGSLGPIARPAQNTSREKTLTGCYNLALCRTVT